MQLVEWSPCTTAFIPVPCDSSKCATMPSEKEKLKENTPKSLKFTLKREMKKENKWDENKMLSVVQE